MGKNYINEKEGQIDFFNQFHIDYINNEVLIDNTDGVWNGNLIEFKTNIKDINEALLQAIKYLSKLRIRGKNVPATIILVSLNDGCASVFKSEDYRTNIEKVHIGAASKNNSGFVRKDNCVLINYGSGDPVIASSSTIKLSKILKENNFMKVNIDEDCICGWAERYYSENPKASKGDFLGDNEGKIKIVGEIREPKVFKDYILPYKGKTNEKFMYLMDKLNDRLKKKDLGAFYTPLPYAKKACELVMKAIERVPEGNDYVIIDRCAGTGNLESQLIGLKDKNGDDVISHCILSTYEYYEYKVLQERLGSEVLFIVPPREDLVQYLVGCIVNANAMCKEFIENPDIQEYIQNPKCTIILFENPPFVETTSVEHQKLGHGKSSSQWKKEYAVLEMKKEISGVASNDMANVFIWSAFKYYLREETDSYIIFSPIKYWKAQHIINKECIGAYIFNKKHFHATSSAITCLLLKNLDTNKNYIKAEVYDIIDDKIAFIKEMEIKRVYKLYSTNYDNRRFHDDESGPYCELNGNESNRATRINPIRNDNIVGYMVTQSFGFENPRLGTNFTRFPIYNGNGFYVRKDNYLEKLVMFAAAKYPIEDSWFENGIIYKSFDKGTLYTKDKNLMKSSLIYTGLSYYTKHLSIIAKDGYYYRNEMCFDSTNGETVASLDLARMPLNDDEKVLISLWRNILEEAKETKNYNANLTYGVYQITRELNTSHSEGKGKDKKKIYHYPNLNGDLNSLRILLKEYYQKYITPKLFKYELLK